jgi:PTS system nitrogen regulatory IIA component
MFSDKVFREQLIAAPAAADLHALISNWHPHVPDQHRAAV